MKKGTIYLLRTIVLLILIACVYHTGYAQIPQLLNYQGVARNSVGNAIPNKTMTLRLTIRNGSASGSSVYTETRKITTNGGGLFAVQIGSPGTVSSTGTMSGVNWLSGSKYLQVELDPEGGLSFIDMGTTQLVSVPYAMSAETAATATPVGNAGGELAGTYPNPTIANNVISTVKLVNQSVTTSKIADAAITDAKIVDVSGAKVTGNISGLASNVSGIVSLANGGTGATTAAAAKANLALENVDNTSDLSKPISTATQNALNTKEISANKSSDPSLGKSDVLYPTQNAVKTYVDLQVVAATPDATSTSKGKIQLAGDITGTSDQPVIAAAAVTTAKIADAAVTNAKINTVSGSKVVGNISGNAANVTGVVSISNGGTGANTLVGARTELNINNLDNTSDANKPVSIATQIALDAKEKILNKSTNTALGTSDDLYPTQKAVKTYVDAQIVGATPDATATTKGKIQLTGDLANTASDPRIAAGAVNTSKLADAAVSTVKLIDGSVTTAKLNDAAVSTAKLIDASVTTVKLNDASVSTVKLIDGSVTTAKLEDGAVGTAKLIDASVTTAKLNDASVTNAKIVSVAGTKVTGDISGNAANVNGIVAIANGGTGANTVADAKVNLALENVENTSDLNKPVSTLTQNALNAKENLSNKSTNTSLGTSDDAYPSQNAVKTYVDTKTGSLVSSVGAISATANANGATITSGVLNLTPADASNGGVVTTGTQTFAGRKTFSSDIDVNGVKIGRGLGNNIQNVAIGADALASGTGSRNTAVGYGAMRQYSGNYYDNNTSVGYWNMPGLTIGSGNTSVGAESMLNLSTGSQNTSVGNQSLINTTGNNNVGIGKRSGEANTTGSQNTFIGTNTTAGSGNLTNATAIGYEASVASSNSIQLGNASVTNVKTSGTITAGTVTYPSSHGTNGQVLATTGSGTLVWQNATSLSNTYYGWPLTLSSTHNGAIIYTEHGSLPTFPNDLPDGFVVTIIMHSNYPWTSNTLSTARFYSKNTGWNNAAGSTTFSMPSGGTAVVRVVTIGGQKCYFVSGDIQ